MKPDGSNNGTTVIQRRIIHGNEQLHEEVRGGSNGISAPTKYKKGWSVEEQLVKETSRAWTVRILKSLDLKVLFGIGIMHAVAVAMVVDAFFGFTPWNGFITPSGLVVCYVWYVLTGGFGITFNFHRLLTHRSFETTRWIRNGTTILGAAAWEGPPIRWVAQHRKHHQFSDKEGDPHSPNQGAGPLMRLCWFLWAHTFWFLFKDNHAKELEEKYTPDLLADKDIVLIDKLFWLPQVVVTVFNLGLGYLLGGEYLASSFALCGGPLRIFFVHHFTWAVNSVSHIWGSQPHKDTRDNSRNNMAVALTTFGEGWHNNHHKFPTSAAHGMEWWQFDPTYRMIQLLTLMGLAWNVRLPAKTRQVQKSASD